MRSQKALGAHEVEVRGLCLLFIVDYSSFLVQVFLAVVPEHQHEGR